MVGALVADQGLIEPRLALNDVDQVVDHATFAAHDQVEITKAHIKIDNDGLVASQGQTGSDGCRAGGLADPALS
ncbi:hypothetical protein GCM10010082_21950 [Kushneria pakistanensis]|uniref:Uncharacterized protein n=1 Tax=Kushneria pakistanensis TaxID=1508770 RepID=A0ABQ3FKR5_9GAMM|nr:hypothetical protein GCM10010082_21950 [Kushneria pakistanensis]